MITIISSNSSSLCEELELFLIVFRLYWVDEIRDLGIETDAGVDINVLFREVGVEINAFFCEVGVEINAFFREVVVILVCKFG